MRTVQLGPLTARITGGSDREGGGDGPVVVLLHGFGAPGDDLVPLWRVVDAPSDVRWVFPAAPLSLAMAGFGMDSRAWWLIDMVALERSLQTGESRMLAESVPEGLPEAREAVLEALDAIDTELTPSSMVLGGFSQGAMLSLDVALHSERALAGLVLMSGTLVSRDEWVPRMPARSGLKVLQSHGRQDPLLPFAAAEELRDHMTGAGMDVDFIPFHGGHAIPPNVLDGLERHVRAAAERR